MTRLNLLFFLRLYACPAHLQVSQRSDLNYMNYDLAPKGFNSISVKSKLVEFWTRPRLYICLVVWKSYQKWRCYPLDNIFAITGLREKFSAFKGNIKCQSKYMIWSEFKHIRDLMPVLVRSAKCHKNQIGTKRAMLWASSNLFFSFVLKGKLLQSEKFDLARILTCPRFYACPGNLQVS